MENLILRDTFITYNKDTIHSYIQNYYTSSQRILKNLNTFYFHIKEIMENDPFLSWRYDDNEVASMNGSIFMNMKDYLSYLGGLGFFNKEVEIEYILYKFYDFNNSPGKIDYTKYHEHKIYFNLAMITKEGYIILKENEKDVSKLPLLDFLIGYREKKYLPFYNELNARYDKYLNEMESPIISLNSLDEYGMRNLLYFKSIFNCVTSTEFAESLAKDYIDYIESLNPDFAKETIEALKNIEPKFKVKWTFDEIVSFSKKAITGPLGIELLLTIFKSHKFFLFSKERMVLNFNVCGMWESFPINQEGKMQLVAKLINLIDTIFSINFSSLNYEMIDSRDIVAGLIDRLLNYMDFYVEESELKKSIEREASFKKVDTIKAFLESNLIEYFKATDEDLKEILNSSSDKSSNESSNKDEIIITDTMISHYLRKKNFCVTNNALQVAYINFCKANGFYNKANSILFDKAGMEKEPCSKSLSTEIHRQIKQYLLNQNYLYDEKKLYDDRYPNINEKFFYHNLKKGNPIILKKKVGKERRYLGLRILES